MYKPSSKHLITITVLIALSSASSLSAAGWLDRLLGGGSEEQSSASSSENSGVNVTDLSSKELTQAFTQALRLGSERVISQLGKPDGFNKDAAIRIALPDKLVTMKGWLDKAGLGASLDDLEVRLNHAAELATPEAKALFLRTIEQMSFEDVKGIYQGGNDAATRYFQAKMTPALTTSMAPIVEQSLSQAGAVKVYDQALSQYKAIPFVPDLKANLVTHVVDGGLNGIFHYLAKEEAAIRENPVKRTTELLRRVFGAQ